MDLCTTYNITDPVEFVEQWMAFSVSNLNGAEPTLDRLSEMERKELVGLLKKDNKATSTASRPHRQSNAYGTNSPSSKVLSSFSTGNDADDFMDSYIECTTPKVSTLNSYDCVLLASNFQHKKIITINKFHKIITELSKSIGQYSFPYIKLHTSFRIGKTDMLVGQCKI